MLLDLLGKDRMATHTAAGDILQSQGSIMSKRWPSTDRQYVAERCGCDSEGLDGGLPEQPRTRPCTKISYV